MKKLLVLFIVLILTINNSEELKEAAKVQENNIKNISTAVLHSDKTLDLLKIEQKEIIKTPVILTGYDNDYACTGKTPKSKGYGVTNSGITASRGSMASPSGINFGTKVHIINAPEDVKKDRVVDDRGGAIKIENGVYHFDLWFPTHNEAIKFGKRNGYMYWINNELYIEIT